MKFLSSSCSLKRFVWLVAIGVFCGRAQTASASLHYDFFQPLFSLNSEYRDTFNIDASTTHTFSAELDSDGKCWTTRNGKRSEGERVSCKPLMLQAALKDRLAACKPESVVLKHAPHGGKYDGGYFSYEHDTDENLSLTQDCLCLQGKTKEVWGGPRTWFWPLNIFNGPTNSNKQVAPACSLKQLLSLFGDGSMREKVRDAYAEVEKELKHASAASTASNPKK